MLKTSKLLTICFAIIFTASGLALRAASVEDLRSKSATLSDQIKKLDAEIASINSKLVTTKSEKKTLSAELVKIDTARKKLVTELTMTEKQISLSNLNIVRLASEIDVKQRSIETDRVAIREALRNYRDREDSGLLELALSGGRLSEIIGQTESIIQLGRSLNARIGELNNNKATLETKKSASEAEKKTLTGLKSQLTDQKQLVDQTKKEKDTLLTETKNKESAYQQMIADRQAKKKQVEQEMAKVEEQIKIAIDPSLLPKSGSSPLSWPVTKVIITQYFGNTDFATKHAVLYNGKGHNGIDLGVSLGSTVMSAADGQIVGAGDTDKTCPGASYGKWILIKHNNGLSTLYGHLSLIKVSEGQKVAAGDLIGYSGNTGYSTGPHLHFTVYASQGVQVTSLQSKVKGCGVYRMPVASYNSYLNPLQYLNER